MRRSPAPEPTASVERSLARDETVLITGASAGIGRELARLFAADGARLVLLARREERLRELAAELERQHGVSAHVAALDLADPATPERLLAWLDQESLSIDILVNNAGFGMRGPFVEGCSARQIDMLRVNVLALTRLTRLLLPSMIQRGRGGVLNVASTAAFQPGPLMAVYYATKAYVLSFSEALFAETRGTGVVVTCLCPGPTTTEFQEVAGMSGTKLVKLGAETAAAAARTGHRGLRRGRAVVISGSLNRLAAISTRVMPRSLVRRLVQALQS